MKPFSLLVKPAGADCNLACPYCFYRPKSALHADAHPRMDRRVLERALASYAALPLPSHDVAFQGGEPLLAGEEFFRRAAEIAPGVRFSVQTNATLATDSIARFFAENGWLVGVSPHSRSAEFMRGYGTLVRAGAAVNVLQLVTRDLAGDPAGLYHYIRDTLGCMHHQYIECTWPRAFAVDSGAWGGFMSGLFDEWLRCGDVRRVSVRTFDSIVSEIAFGVPALCQFSDDCRHHLVVEANGDVYPCDFFVEPALKLGNVMENTWEEMAGGKKYAEFGRRKRGHADCPRNRDRLDAGWRRFYGHALPVLSRLAAELSAR